MSKPRVCAVSYLNTAPLVWGMLHGPQKGRFDLDFALPSECADRLGSGAADIGIVPCAELERLDLSVIPGTGIACRGAVRSILLVTKRPPDQIRSLALDSSSRTSVLLARIILARRYGAEPATLTLPPDPQAMLAQADAAVLIGDPALRVEPDGLAYTTLDLGEEWLTLTGLPMVFAVWGCRKRLDPAELAPVFRDSCRFGLERLDEIIDVEAARRRIPRDRAEDYLRHRIVFELGEAEESGMRLFLEYARDFVSLVSAT